MHESSPERFGKALISNQKSSSAFSGIISFFFKGRPHKM